MLDRIRKNFKNKLLKQKLKKENIIIKENSKFRKTTFEGSNLIGKNVDVEKSFIGFGSAIGENSELANCKIGKFCSIGPNTSIALGKHPTRDFVSTHNFCFDDIDLGIGLNFLDELKYHEKYKAYESYYINIGNDVWIGKNVTILSGITIGDGAIIAAGSVVTKDIEPYSIAGGVPAKLIRKRFSESQIEFLLNYSWWDKDINWIKDNVELFGNIERFTSELSI